MEVVKSSAFLVVVNFFSITSPSLVYVFYYFLDNSQIKVKLIFDYIVKCKIDLITNDIKYKLFDYLR